MRRQAVMVALLFTAAAVGCSKDPARDQDTLAHGKAEIVIVQASNDAVEEIVARELPRAKADSRDLLVYVGASWCEPCMHFHDAVKAGELDDTFPTLRLIEFDHDRDGMRLAKAGYVSRMIPLFAVPDASGRASGLQMAGSIKGDGAVAEIVPRLRTLLAQSRERK